MTRKETPDVLGELLAGPPVADLPVAAPAVQPAAKPRTRRAAATPGDGKRTQPTPAAPAVHGWDYLIISFSDHRGWRPRFINGQEIRNWSQAPLIHEYLAQLGEDGWELVGAGGGKALYGASDYYQLFLKRAKR